MQQMEASYLKDFNWWLGWIACGFTLLGAVLIAAHVEPVSVYVMNSAAVLYTWWAIRKKETSLAIVNIGLLAIYSYGTIIRLYA